jgi:hypothetical protein
MSEQSRKPMTPEDQALEAEMYATIIRGSARYGSEAFNDVTNKLRQTMDDKQWHGFRESLAGRADAHEIVYEAASTGRTRLDKRGRVAEGVSDVVWNSSAQDLLSEREYDREYKRRQAERHSEPGFRRLAR